MSSLSNSRRSDELGGVTSKMTPPSNHSSINDSKRTTPQTPQSSHNVPMRFKSAVPENLSLTSSVDSVESLSHRSNDNVNNTARRTDSGRILTSGRSSSSNSNRAKDDKTQKLSARRNNDNSNRSSGSNYDRKKDDGEYKSDNNNNNRIDSSSSNGHRSNNDNHHSSSNTNTAKMTNNINKNNTVSKPGILTTTEADDRHRFKRAYNTPISLEENAVVAVYREREIKVFEASNDERKMPVIPEHQNWLLNREVEMKKKEEKYFRSVLNGKNNKDTTSSKNSSSKDGKKDHNTKDTTKTKDNNNNNKPSSANGKSTTTTTGGKPITPLKKGTTNGKPSSATSSDTQLQQSSSSAKLPYTLATEFMTSQFPSFAVNQNQQRQQQELQLLQSQQIQQERERKSKHQYDSKVDNDNNNSYNNQTNQIQQLEQQQLQPESESILHQRQIKECQSIMKAFEKQHLSAPNSTALINALVLPQDLPDVISVGQLKMNAMCLTEKLMNNPLPVEFLRTNKLLKSVNTGKKGKKKKTAATV